VELSANSSEHDDPPGDQDFEEIDIAEEELIDAYVRDELSLDERKLLEKGLRTSPHLLERLHFARLLADAADRPSEREVPSYRTRDENPARESWWLWLTSGPRPAFQMAIAAAALIVFIGGAGLLAGWIRLRRESQYLAEQQAALERQKSELRSSASEQRSATEQLRAQLREEQQKREADRQRIAELLEAQNQKPTASSATIATLFLPRLLRSGEQEKVLIPTAGTSKVKLFLAVDSIEYRGFLVEVKNKQDKVIFPQKVRPPRSGKVVSVTIPRNLLPAGSYSVQLSGISPDGASELVGNYTFKIVAGKN
jgi:hypothetical protein